jgi:multicomponent K+:H+ antiporter subunit E
MSLSVFALWLALSGSVGVGALLMALALALLLPIITRSFWPDPPRVQSYGAALRLLGIVLVDIVSANLTVARQVLGPIEALRPAFFEFPVDLDDAFVATLLGGIISLTPGTVTIDIETENGRPVRLRVHGLDVPDTAATIAQIKARYEAPLKEIFGC